MEVHIISERQFLAPMFSLSHSLSFLTSTGGALYVINKVFNPLFLILLNTNPVKELHLAMMMMMTVLMIAAMMVRCETGGWQGGWMGKRPAEMLATVLPQLLRP